MSDGLPKVIQSSNLKVMGKHFFIGSKYASSNFRSSSERIPNHTNKINPPSPTFTPSQRGEGGREGRYSSFQSEIETIP